MNRCEVAFRSKKTAFHRFEYRASRDVKGAFRMSNSTRKQRESLALQATMGARGTRVAIGAESSEDIVDHRAAIGRLIARELTVRVDPSPTNVRALRDTRHRLMTSGRAWIVALVRSALGTDGGRLARIVAEALPKTKEHAAAAVQRFVEISHEHGITASSAVSLLFRSCLEGTAADSLLAGLVTGTAQADAGRATALANAARTDLLAALELQKRADDAQRQVPVSWPPPPRYQAYEPSDEPTPNGEGGCHEEASSGEDDEEHNEPDDDGGDAAQESSTDAFERGDASCAHIRGVGSGISAVPLGNLVPPRNLNFSSPSKGESRDEFPEELFDKFEGQAANSKDIRARQLNVRRAESVMRGPPVVADATLGPSPEARKRIAEMERRCRAQQKALGNKE